MAFLVNDVEYNGGVVSLEGMIIATFTDKPGWDVIQTMPEVATVGDYTVDGIVSIRYRDNDVEIRWTDAETTEARLEKANAELDAIKNALSELGDGVTLAKLKTFLTAVKEAVGYDE